MAWLSVLAAPVRSNYATDSAAMLGKALKLIEAAKAYEANQAQHAQKKARSSIQPKEPYWR